MSYRREDFKNDSKDELIDKIFLLREDNEVRKGQLNAATAEVMALVAKCKEQETEMKQSADKTRQFKALQKVNEDLGKEVNKLNERILDLEDANATMVAAVGEMHPQVESLNKSLKEKTHEYEDTRQALEDTRVRMRDELAECGKEKSVIHESLESAIAKLREDVSAANAEKTKKTLAIDRLGMNISKLKTQILALKQVEARQREQMQGLLVKHERDQESLRLTSETLTNELNTSKAEVKILKQELENSKASLKKFQNLMNARPKSPIAKALKEADKKPGDDKAPKCKFVRIGSKKDEFGNEIGDYKKDCSGKSGRKSPLNPNQLARKIKLLF